MSISCTHSQTCRENACHPEPMRFAQGKLSAGSGSPDAQILRCAQDDSQDTAHNPLTASLLSKRLTHSCLCGIRSRARPALWYDFSWKKTLSARNG
jgi:hypothetical protein